MKKRINLYIFIIKPNVLTYLGYDENIYGPYILYVMDVGTTRNIYNVNMPLWEN